MKNLIEKADLILEAYWGTAGAGILPIALDTGRILVPYRSRFVNEPNTYGVWGGAIDSGENPKAAAEREFDEETGYTGKMDLIAAYKFKDGSFTYSNFIGLVPSEFKPRLDWETESFDWVTLDELKKLRPKHFGLKGLLKNSMSLIEKYVKDSRGIVEEDTLLEGRLKAPKAIYEAVLKSVYGQLQDLLEYEIGRAYEDDGFNKSQIKKMRQEVKDASSVYDWIFDLEYDEANAGKRYIVAQFPIAAGVGTQVTEGGYQYLEALLTKHGFVLFEVTESLDRPGLAIRDGKKLLERSLKGDAARKAIDGHVKRLADAANSGIDSQEQILDMRKDAMKKASDTISKKAGSASSTVNITQKMIKDWSVAEDTQKAFEAIKDMAFDKLDVNVKYKDGEIKGQFSQGGITATPTIDYYVEHPVWSQVGRFGFISGLDSTIEHEVIHWSQIALPVVLGKQGVFGLPSRAAADFVDGTYDREGYLSSGMEFFPWLNNEIRKLKSYSGPVTKDQLKRMVSNSEFFKSLRQRDTKLWKKAVRELYREFS